MKQNIEDRLRESFYDLEITPPADMWEKIDATLVSEKVVTNSNKTKGKSIKLISAITATAAALLLPVILLMQNSENNDVASSLSVGVEIVNSDSISSKVEQLLGDTDIHSDNMAVAHLASAEKRDNKSTLSQNDKSPKLDNDADISSNSNDIEKDVDPEAEQVAINDKIRTKSEPSAEGMVRRAIVSDVNSSVYKNSTNRSKSSTDRARNSKKSGVSIAASGSGIGAGGDISKSFDNNIYMAPNDMSFGTIMNSQGVYLYKAQVPVRDWTHNVPLSFSVNVRKMFTRSIGIESGFTYTYLSSNAKARNEFDYSLSRRLHYIGVPLSLVCNIYENKKLSLYAKGGILVDYAVSAEEIKKYNNERQVSKIDAKGVQCSAILNAGIAYKATPLLSFYLEPSLSYYFDSSQPMSYRTENNIGFGATLGVRFSL